MTDCVHMYICPGGRGDPEGVPDVVRRDPAALRQGPEHVEPRTH